MAHQIPFSQSTFVLPDALVPGNSTSVSPVTFHLFPAQGPDKARLKSTIFATWAIADPSQEWTEDIQKAVIASYGNGAQVFIRCVDKIDNLTIPGLMAKRALIIPPDQHDSVPDAASIPIVSGTDFAMISGYVITMSFVVAMEIAKISREMEEVDPRLFVPPSGSPSAATPGPMRGTAGNARKRSGRRAIAG